MPQPSAYNPFDVRIADLEQQQQRLLLLLDSISDHLVSYDREWRFTFVNDGAARMLGRPRADLLGRSVWELFPEAVGNPYWTNLHEAVATRCPMVSEHYFAPWQRWFENHIYPSADGVTVFANDISERKKVQSALAARESALLAADRRKDEFLATLAHELRSPLAPIRQAALLAASPQASPEQVRWSHDVVDRQVQHMSRLLDDLLEVSRISRGGFVLRPVRVLLTEVMDAAVETARPLIDARAHRLTIHNACGDLILLADGRRLSQLLSNLLSNAARYTPPAGQVELRAWLDAGSLCLSVKDDGIGVAAEHLNTVFAMFSQVAPASERSESGLGIGLALVKGIAESHGGSVTAASRGLGHGCEVLVRLPLPPLQQRDAVAAVPATTPAARLKVLVADDNHDAACTLAMLLELEGHVVQTAADGREALRLAINFKPDVALLDIGMPGLSGLELAAALRGENWAQGLRLIAVSGWGDDASRARALAAGFDEHVTKPAEPDRLRSLLVNPSVSRR